MIHPKSAQAAISNHELLKSHSLIDGRWESATKTFPVHDPATGGIIVEIFDQDSAKLTLAIESAQTAFELYQKTTEHQRSKFLHRYAELIRQNAKDLATLLTLENGKTFAEALGEVEYGASFISWFAEEAIRSYGDIIPSQHPGSTNFVIKQPIGVCGIITPWNFPVAMITRKIGPALAAGCSVVIKPPEETPLCPLALGVLFQQAATEANLPSGIMQVVATTDHDVARLLYTHPVIKKVSFTGSTPVGKLITSQAAGTMKKISMELGGNAPYIVFDDVDIEAAVDGVLACKYRCSGQTCVCANRLYVQSGIHDRFVEALLGRVKNFKVGSEFDPAVTHGPLINKAAVAKVEEHIADAVAKGGTLLFGGERPAQMANDQLRGGFYLQPALITGATRDMKVAVDETFGPLAPIFRFDTVDEVVQMANDTEFGLAGYFFSKDLDTIWKVAKRLEVGMVGVNTGKISAAEAPFGGIKESGLGKEGSKYGLAEFQIIKSITLGGMS